MAAAAHFAAQAQVEIEDEALALIARFNATDNGDGWYKIGEEISAELRSIGFHSSYETAEQFLEWFCDLLEEERRSLVERKLSEIDDAVPAPELSELAANDPAVQAAKQAYDLAVAKQTVRKLP